MTYDHELTLIGVMYDKDEWGNQIEITTERTILCSLQSVKRNEFYNASVSGHKPELVFIIHSYEYDNEQKVRFEGKEYNVIRNYRKSFEEMELICEAVIGNG